MCKNKQFILVEKKMFEKKKWFTITQIVKTSFHLEKYSEFFSKLEQQKKSFQYIIMITVNVK